MKTLNVVSTIERRFDNLPRFLCIPTAKVAPWRITATTTVEGTMNGIEIGRRSLKHWEERGCWWMDLPETLCRKAQVEVGDMVKLSLRVASEELPEELMQLLRTDPNARARWQRLTPRQQRMLREEVTAAKKPSTRARRAAEGLGL